MLRAFVSEHLMYENGSFISCEEVRDVFCGISIRDTTDSAAVFALLTDWLDATAPSKPPLIPMIRRIKHDYPSRRPGPL